MRLWVHLIGKLEMIGEKTNFHENLENEMRDFVIYFITLLSFSWNPILWVEGKKDFP